MKNLIVLFCLVLMMLLFTGCSDSSSSEDVTSIHDLVVPEGFNFETTHLVRVVAHGAVNRTLVITMENGDIVYKGLLDSSAGFDKEILLATNISSLDFTYNGQTINRAICPATDYVSLNFTGVGREVLEDSDGDGIPDDEDDYPNDPTRAYILFYPPQPPPDSTRCWCRPNWGTMAFEDLWPNEGDYDFNDVIINYQISEDLNYCGNVRDIYFDLYYSVDGAGYNNGLYFKVPFDEEGTAYIDYPDSVVTPGREGFDFFYDTENGGDGNLVLRVFEEGQSFMTGTNEFHNTEAEGGFTDPFHFVLHVELVNSTPYYNRPLEDLPPYNPFLVINQDIEREVHFDNYHPTGRVNVDFFGTENDTSDPLTERYYVTAGDLPWGMHIPSLFDNPLERISILDAYPQFADWVTSSGMDNEDWYDYPVEGNVYDFVDQYNDFLGY